MAFDPSISFMFIQIQSQDFSFEWPKEICKFFLL